MSSKQQTHGHTKRKRKIIHETSTQITLSSSKNHHPVNYYNVQLADYCKHHAKKSYAKALDMRSWKLASILIVAMSLVSRLVT